MTLPSFTSGWRDGQPGKPRIYMLSIRNKKNPDKEPIAHLLVEREEAIKTDDRDKSIWEASLRISYELSFKMRHF